MGNPFKLSAIGANDYNFLGRSKGINSFPTTFTNPLKTGENYGLEQRMASQNRELTPKQFDIEAKGSTYLNGRGHSEYGAFPPYLA